MTLNKKVPDIVNESEDPLLSIHPSWDRIKLGSIANILNGYAFKSKLFNKERKGIPIIRIRDVGEKSSNTYYSGEYDKRYIINKDDIIIGMDGDFNCAKWTGIPSLLNQRVCKIEITNDSYNKDFLFLTLPGYLKAINEHTSSQTVKHLSSKSIYEIPLPFPPLPEQHRIVAAIEALFARLDATEARLARVPEIMKQFRQSVLAAACEGRLTEDWQEEDKNLNDGKDIINEISNQKRILHGIKKSPKRIIIKNLPSIQDKWIWVSLDEISDIESNSITDGPFGSNLKTEHYTNSGPRVIRLQNIGDGIFLDEKAHISLNHFEKLQKHQIFKNDIVIGALGDPLPRACLIPQNIGPAIVKADCIRLCPHKKITNASYLIFAINNIHTRKRMAELIHGVGRSRLNLSEIKSMPIPLPPLPEQEEIVRRVDSLLAFADQIEARVIAAEERTEKLRQSILEQAFSGRLVEDKRQSDYP